MIFGWISGTRHVRSSRLRMQRLIPYIEKQIKAFRQKKIILSTFEYINLWNFLINTVIQISFTHEFHFHITTFLPERFIYLVRVCRNTQRYHRRVLALRLYILFLA